MDYNQVALIVAVYKVKRSRMTKHLWMFGDNPKGADGRHQVYCRTSIPEFSDVIRRIYLKDIVDLTQRMGKG